MTEDAKRPVFVMAPVAHSDPEIIEAISQMTGQIPVEEDCEDCGQPCLRAKEDVAVAGFAHAEPFRSVKGFPENIVKVCGKCAAQRAYAIGDWEAGVRYQMAYDLMAERYQG